MWFRWGWRGGLELDYVVLSILVFILRVRGGFESVLSRGCDKENIRFMFCKDYCGYSV